MCRPAAMPLRSNFVSGRSDQRSTGPPSSPGSASSTTRICSAYSSQSVASRHAPPGRSRPATSAANDAVTHFKLDTLWDMASHPQGWYFRSDHLPYARLNIPAIAYTSDLHADYHTPRDEPSRIDMAKVTRVAKWMYATGWTIANAPTRPAIDAGFKLER